MRKLENNLEIKKHTNWYIKDYSIEEISIIKGESLYKNAMQILDNFKLTSLPNAKTKNAKFNFPKKSFKRLRESLNKLDVNEKKYRNKNNGEIPSYFEELDSQFKDSSQGKISLSTVVPHKKIEKLEETTSSVFDLGCNFSESAKIKLAELKIREENLKAKSTTKKIIKKQ